MENPNPVNLMTPEESRSLGWAAEARDDDGHLMNQHGQFENDAFMAHYIREAIQEGWTVTVWPIPIESKPLLANPFD